MAKTNGYKRSTLPGNSYKYWMRADDSTLGTPVYPTDGKGRTSTAPSAALWKVLGLKDGEFIVRITDIIIGQQPTGSTSEFLTLYPNDGSLEYTISVAAMIPPGSQLGLAMPDGFSAALGVGGLLNAVRIHFEIDIFASVANIGE